MTNETLYINPPNYTNLSLFVPRTTLQDGSSSISAQATTAGSFSASPASPPAIPPDDVASGSCQVCKKNENPSSLPQDKRLELRWRKGQLILPVPAASTPEEELATAQDLADLRDGGLVKFTFSPCDPKMRDRMLRLQHEQLLDLRGKKNGGQQWALQGGADALKKVIWTPTSEAHRLFVSHFPAGAVEKEDGEGEKVMGSSSSDSHSSTSTKPVFTYPAVRDPGACPSPIFSPEYLADVAWGPDEAAKLQLTLLTANFH